MAPETATVEERMNKLTADLAASEGKLLLNEKLSASKLPQPAARIVREHFAGRAANGEEIDREIKLVRESFAAMVPGGIATTGGAVVLMEPEDKMQVALDKLFALRNDPNGKPYNKDVPAFGGIREAYIALTGDREIAWNQPVSQGRITEEWNSAGFANALGNTMYRRLVADYLEVDYGLDLLIPPREPHRVALRDFRTHEIVRVGYMDDLPQTDPELIDWPEITAPTDEKATISAVQFGGLVTVTRKAVINDDIGLVARIAQRLGRAARRTMAQRVFNLIINNAAIYDSIALFDASTHKNLGATALSTAELDVVRTAMFTQTEKNSGKQIGIVPYILVVPVQMQGLATQENNRGYLDSNFTPSKVQFMFGTPSGAGGGEDLTMLPGGKPPRMIVSPLLTDVNDWYVFANPDQAQTFELGFLQGKAEPELLLADNQLVGKAFSSDRIQYKVRHEYEIAIVDFRGAYKEVVA